jgi:hypothetical protein
MDIFIYCVGVVLVLGVLRTDGMLKKHLENDKRIIERLDAIINNQKQNKNEP